MNSFIDNRVWLIDFEFNYNKLQKDFITDTINGTDEIFQNCIIDFESSLVNYDNDIRYIEIQLDKNGLKLITSKYYNNSIDFDLSKLVIRIMENGFLNIISTFINSKNLNLSEISDLYKLILISTKKLAFYLYEILIKKMISNKLLNKKNVVNFFEYNEF